MPTSIASAIFGRLHESRVNLHMRQTSGGLSVNGMSFYLFRTSFVLNVRLGHVRQQHLPSPLVIYHIKGFPVFTTLSLMRRSNLSNRTICRLGWPRQTWSIMSTCIMCLAFCVQNCNSRNTSGRLARTLSSGSGGVRSASISFLFTCELLPFQGFVRLAIAVPIDCAIVLHGNPSHIDGVPRAFFCDCLSALARIYSSFLSAAGDHGVSNPIVIRRLRWTSFIRSRTSCFDVGTGGHRP